MQQQQTVSWIVICNEKFILYNWQRPRRSPSALPKAKLVPKSSHSLWQAAASLIHCSFLNPIETTAYEKYIQHINEMCQNCNAFSQHWLIERAQFFSMTIPITHHTTNTSKVEQIGLQSFASSAIFT